MEIISRAAVRIVCLDAQARVLLLSWQDPSDGRLLWEPPGGGIEAGETPIEAARRELTEETGLDPGVIDDRAVVVTRDVVWNGTRYVGPEPFFLARFNEERPRLHPRGLQEDEQQNLRGHIWLAQVDLAALADPLEPPHLPLIIVELCPDSPWKAQGT